MDLFTLSAKLQLDKSDYDKGLEDAESRASKVGGAIMGGFGTMAKVGVAGMAAVGAATVGTTTALVDGAGKVAEYGDNIDKMSQKMGISAEAYQEWDAIMQHSGTSIDSMSRGMQTLQKNAVNSAEKFEALGITQEQLANMSTEELFSATITGLQNMGEGAERTALASELLGGSAKELGALLNTSAEDTEAMRQRVHELGGVMSDDAVKAAAAFQDSLQDMQTGFEGLKRNMLADFLPATTTVMDGLTAIFAGDFDEGLEKLSEGITEFVDNISEKLPEVMKVGGAIIEALATALVENLPVLFEAGMGIVGQLAEGVLNSLPEIVETALSMMETFATGLIDAIPEMIPAIVDIIMQIIETLTSPDTLVKLVMAAVQLAIAIATGLIQAIPQIIMAVPKIIGNLVVAIVELVPQLVMAGVQLIMGLIQGILSLLGNLLATGKNLIDSLISTLLEVGATLVGIGADLINFLIDGITSLFGSIFDVGADIITQIGDGIGSFIGNAVTWGKDLIGNFINGIKSMAGQLWDTIKGIASGIKDFLGFSEPKLGPLSNFHTYAPDMMDLFMQGINDKQRELQNTVASAFDFQDIIEGKVNVKSVSNGGNNNDLYGMLQNIVGMLPSLGNMQIVLDTGALVGQTVGAYDVALGQLYTDKTRSV